MPTVPSELSLLIDQDNEIDRPPEVVFAALVRQLGPEFNPGHGMKMTLELRPGGRWYRDLGNDQGHLWGHVQVVKRPALLEITGPLFMSYAAVSHLQFRLTPVGENKTKLSLRHQALGLIQDEHRQGVKTGWTEMLEGIRKHAEHTDG